MSSDRSAEIWSTRLQRELLALTADGDKQGDAVILPAFVAVKDHDLNLEKGTCNVSFDISVDKRNNCKNAASETAGKEETDVAEEDGVGKQKHEAEGASEECTDEAAISSTAKTVVVTIALIASLSRRPDGSVDQTSMAYPFLKPMAVLLNGAEHFPDNSTIKNGDFIDIDCDWTPSLHLNDAALNVALKIRESVKRGDPFDASPVKKNSDNLIGAKKVSSFFSALRQKAAGVADEIDQATAVKPKAKAASPTAAKPKVKAASPTAATTAKPLPQSLKSAPHSDKSKKAKEMMEIGHTIDLSQAPWNACVGMYSCKAIRRPEFMTAAISIANQDATEKVAGAGFVGAGSVFRSFTQSAKTVLEESFVMINDEYIIEIRCNRFSVATATVTFAIPVSFLAKLKFRRQESISLFFKQAPDDPLIYMCPESADAVKQIQSILKRHGVRGKHTNATTQRLIQSALHIVSDIQSKERTLESGPSLDKVNEIMDLYRQSAEKFEAAGDARHEEVMSHMHKFLAKPLTMSIIDGSHSAEQRMPGLHERAISLTPEGEVLDGHLSDSLLEYDDNMAATKEDDFHKTMKSAEDIFKEAHNDMKDFGIDDDDLDDLLTSPRDKDKFDDFNDFDVNNVGDSDEVDAVSELEDMLKNADKELAELMGS